MAPKNARAGYPDVLALISKDPLAAFDLLGDLVEEGGDLVHQVVIPLAPRYPVLERHMQVMHGTPDWRSACVVLGGADLGDPPQ